MREYNPSPNGGGNIRDQPGVAPKHPGKVVWTGGSTPIAPTSSGWLFLPIQWCLWSLESFLWPVNREKREIKLDLERFSQTGTSWKRFAEPLYPRKGWLVSRKKSFIAGQSSSSVSISFSLYVEGKMVRRMELHQNRSVSGVASEVVVSTVEVIHHYES